MTMNITSIFRFNGINKNNNGEENKILKINKFLKNKIGVGVGFIFIVITIYVLVTLFTIYNLLVGL